MEIDSSALMVPRRLAFPPPWIGHIPFAAWLIKRIRPRIFVELGTHSGNSYCAFCQAITENKLSAQAFAVDTWEGDEHSTSYGDEVLRDLAAHHDPLYQGFSTLLKMTFDQALSKFEDHQIDLLHIDGFHKYEAVKHDFESWRPKLSDRAVVLFHDTAVLERGFGVHKFFDEMLGRYPGFSLPNSNGLGVLLVGSEHDSMLVELSEKKKSRDEFTDAFVKLGDAVESRYALNSLIEKFNVESQQLLAHRASVHEYSVLVTRLKDALSKCESARELLRRELEEAKQFGADAANRARKFERDYVGQMRATDALRADMKCRIASAQEELNDLQGRINEMERSRVWRLTRSLSRLKNHMNKIFV